MADALAPRGGRILAGDDQSRPYFCGARSARFSPAGHGSHSATAREKQDTIVFASETCAFDLIGATFERDVKPGELVIVGPEGITSPFLCAIGHSQSSCIFEHVYFSRPDSVVFGRAVQESRERTGPATGARSSG